MKVVAPWLMAGLALASAQGAGAAGPAKPAAADVRPIAQLELDRRIEIELRAKELYPRRRDTPLRYLNITDNEIREIQSLAAKNALPEIINISAVVTGCACDEGADCTEQVYVLSRKDGRTVGMQLSRFTNRWGVGRVQRWWLDYAALIAREGKMDLREFEQAHQRLLLEFPMCPSGTSTGTTQIASQLTPGAAPTAAAAGTRK